MANNEFDRTIIHPLEKPLADDINQAQSQADRTLREYLKSLYSNRSSDASPVGAPQGSGFVWDGLLVVPDSPAAMAVDVRAGMGFIDDATDVPTSIDSVAGLDDSSRYKPVALLSDFNFSVPAAPGAPDDRIDIIEVKVDRRTENPLSRLVFNTTTEEFDSTSLDKTLAFTLDGRTGVVTSPTNSTAGLSYKIGVAGNPGAVPSTSPGYVKIAEILVDNTTTSITEAELVDRRALLGDGGFATCSVRFRLQWNGGSPIVTIKDMNLPPGMKSAIYPGGARGIFAWDIYGGEIARASFRGQASFSYDSGSSSSISEGILSMISNETVNFSDSIATVSTATKAVHASGTPVIDAGIGQKFATQRWVVRYVASGGTLNVTDTDLEDLDWYAEAQIGWF